MEELRIFDNPEFGTVRTLNESGTAIFCAKDVASALSYKDTDDAIRRRCRYPVKRRVPHPQSPDKTIEMLFIPESDLYRLVFGSKLPTAEKFTDWVTEEVLPSIRKNGGYIQGQDNMTAEELMAKAVLVAQKTLADREARISALTAQNQIMLPKAEYFDELVERNTLTNFRETAKEIGAPPKAFVQFLLDNSRIETMWAEMNLCTDHGQTEIALRHQMAWLELRRLKEDILNIASNTAP